MSSNPAKCSSTSSAEEPEEDVEVDAESSMKTVSSDASTEKKTSGRPLSERFKHAVRDGRQLMKARRRGSLKLMEGLKGTSLFKALMKSKAEDSSDIISSSLAPSTFKLGSLRTLATSPLTEEPLYVGNLYREWAAHRHHPAGLRQQNTHVWTMFVSTTPFDVVPPTTVASVTYLLHPTFNPRVVTVTEPPFLLTRRGWGYFDVGVRITLKADGTGMSTETETAIGCAEPSAMTATSARASAVDTTAAQHMGDTGGGLMAAIGAKQLQAVKLKMRKRKEASEKRKEVKKKKKVESKKKKKKKRRFDLAVNHPLSFGPVMAGENARGCNLPFVVNSRELSAAHSDQSTIGRRNIDWSDPQLAVKKCAEKVFSLKLEGFCNTVAEIVEALATVSFVPIEVATIIAHFATLSTLKLDLTQFRIQSDFFEEKGKVEETEELGGILADDSSAEESEEREEKVKVKCALSKEEFDAATIPWLKLEIVACFNCALTVVSPLRRMHSLRLDSCGGVHVRFSNADRMVEMRACVGCTLHSAVCSNLSSVRVEHCTDARLQLEDSHQSLYLMDLQSQNTVLQMRRAHVDFDPKPPAGARPLVLDQYFGPKCRRRAFEGTFQQLQNSDSDEDCRDADAKCFLAIWRGSDALSAVFQTHQFRLGRNLSPHFDDL